MGVGFRRALNHTAEKGHWLPLAWVLLAVIITMQRDVLVHYVRLKTVFDDGEGLHELNEFRAFFR